MTITRQSGKLRQPVLVLLYFGVVSAGLYLILSQYAYDDPFITYRYARNLAGGLGFVYNPGEQVLSTTTPLFTILLAGFYPVTSDLPRLANLIGAASLAAGALLIWALAKLWQAPAVGWAGLLLYPTFTLPAATVGSETPLYIALCLAAFTSYAHRRYVLAAGCAALTVLARPDGALVAVVLAGDFLLRKMRPIPWRAVLVYAVILLPWLIFATLYFGSPFPATLAAKQHQGYLEVSQYFAPGFLWILSWYQNGWQYWLQLLLAVVGLFWMARRGRAWSLVLSWTGLYFLAFSLLRVSRYFWYYAPLVPGFIILVGLGAEATLHFLRSKIRLPERTPQVITAFLLIFLSAAQLADLWQMKTDPEPRAASRAASRAAVYQAAGEWLKENTPTDTKIASLEAGILGYYSNRTMVDFAGLLQPEVAAQLVPGATYDGVAVWSMIRYKPSYTVLVRGDLSGLKEGYLEGNCRFVHQFPEEDYDTMAVDIYACPEPHP